MTMMGFGNARHSGVGTILLYGRKDGPPWKEPGKWDAWLAAREGAKGGSSQPLPCLQWTIPEP
jgi:hypothetical protein